MARKCLLYCCNYNCTFQPLSVFYRTKLEHSVSQPVSDVLRIMTLMTAVTMIKPSTSAFHWVLEDDVSGYDLNSVMLEVENLREQGQ